MGQRLCQLNTRGAISESLLFVGKGGTGACVRCEEAGTRPSARVGLAMSVFTHGVRSKGKPGTINHNKVFPVAGTIKSLRERLLYAGSTICLRHRAFAVAVSRFSHYCY